MQVEDFRHLRDRGSTPTEVHLNPAADPRLKTSRRQQFIRPIGRHAGNFVYFQDRRTAEDYDGFDGKNAQLYEQIEEEIHELAGVPRLVPRPYEPTAADLTYEMPSKMLEALQLAIMVGQEEYSGSSFT